MQRRLHRGFGSGQLYRSGAHIRAGLDSGHGRASHQLFEDFKDTGWVFDQPQRFPCCVLAGVK